MQLSRAGYLEASNGCAMLQRNGVGCSKPLDCVRNNSAPPKDTAADGSADGMLGARANVIAENIERTARGEPLLNAIPPIG